MTLVLFPSRAISTPGRFPLQEPRRGNRFRVYTLGSRGRDFLKEELEYPVGWYFRPDKVRHMSFGQVVHNLVLTRFLVAARRWAVGRPEWSLSQTRTCYEIGSAGPFHQLRPVVKIYFFTSSLCLISLSSASLTLRSYYLFHPAFALRGLVFEAIRIDLGIYQPAIFVSLLF